MTCACIVCNPTGWGCRWNKPGPRRGSNNSCRRESVRDGVGYSSIWRIGSVKRRPRHKRDFPRVIQSIGVSINTRAKYIPACCACHGSNCRVYLTSEHKGSKCAYYCQSFHKSPISNETTVSTHRSTAHDERLVQLKNKACSVSEKMILVMKCYISTLLRQQGIVCF